MTYIIDLSEWVDSAGLAIVSPLVGLLEDIL